jgi:hypothetical protein
MVSVTVMILSYFTALIIPMYIISFNYGYAQSNVPSTNTQNTSGVNVTRTNFIVNPNFSFFNDTSGIPSYWYDPIKSCRTTFSCTIKFTDGWNDYVSFSLSTTNNTKNTWSSIRGQEIDVKSKSQYQLVSHMKLNNRATGSHVVLEGFNETSKKWYQIRQCPAGLNGPLEWQEFSCVGTIPENTTKIRPVLNAGWSSVAKEEATSWFDEINVLGDVFSFTRTVN